VLRAAEPVSASVLLLKARRTATAEIDTTVDYLVGA